MDVSFWARSAEGGAYGKTVLGQRSDDSLRGVLDAVHVVRAGFCPSTRMGKFAVPAVLGIALGLMRGEEPRHGRRER